MQTRLVEYRLGACSSTLMIVLSGTHYGLAIYLSGAGQCEYINCSNLILVGSFWMHFKSTEYHCLSFDDDFCVTRFELFTYRNFCHHHLAFFCLEDCSKSGRICSPALKVLQDSGFEVCSVGSKFSNGVYVNRLDVPRS